MKRKLLTYFVMYMVINACTYLAIGIANHTLHKDQFTTGSNILEGIIFWIASILWVILSGIVYWDEKCE